MASSAQVTPAGGKTGGILALDVTPVLLSLGVMVVIFGMWKREKD
jgi:hypothetical protein